MFLRTKKGRAHDFFVVAMEALTTVHDGNNLRASYGTDMLAHDSAGLPGTGRIRTTCSMSPGAQRRRLRICC